MAGSVQDNSSGMDSMNPEVRVKGFQKKSADPLPNTPAIPPQAPNAIPPQAPNQPAVVRFKPSVSSQTPVEDVSVSPPDDALCPADEAVLAEAAGETVEPFEEVPVEQFAASEDPVEPAAGKTTVPAVPSTGQESAPQAQAPNVDAIRQRFRAAAAPGAVSHRPQAGAAGSTACPTSERAGLDVAAQAVPPAGPDSFPDSHGLPPGPGSESGAESGAQPGRGGAPSSPRPYEPDSDQERINRRLWWKHNLWVRSGRQKDEEAQKQA